MSHELSRVNGVVEMVAVGGRWHDLGQGKNLTKPMTKKQMMELSHLGWRVETSKVLMDNGQECEGIVANYRDIGNDQRIFLGAVSEGFQVVQNEDAADQMDLIMRKGWNGDLADLQEGEEPAYFTSAGALNQGRRVWMQAELPGTHEIMKGDAVGKYLLMSNAHDGTRSFRLIFTPVRVVCANTERAALAGVKSGITLRHIGGNLNERVKEAAEAIGLANKHFDAMAEAFTALGKSKADDEKVAAYLKTLYPNVKTKTHVIDRTPTRDKITDFYHTAPGAQIALGTWWGAYNAVTYFEDHGRYATSKMALPRQFEISHLGPGANRKEHAFDLAMKMAELTN